MKKEFMGYLTVIISVILLSLELYGLNFAKYMDMNINGSCYTNAIDYIHETPFSLSFLVTISLIIFGFVLIVKSKNSSNSNE